MVGRDPARAWADEPSSTQSRRGLAVGTSESQATCRPLSCTYTFTYTCFSLGGASESESVSARKERPAASHPRGMPRDVTPRVARIQMPARSGISAVLEIGRVEAQSGDHREGVTASRINCDPATATTFAVTHKITRGQRRGEGVGPMQRKRDRPRAIVTAFVERPVSAAPDIRLVPKRVGRPDRILHSLGCVRWRVSDAVAQDRAVPCDHRFRAATCDLRSIILRLRVVLFRLIRCACCAVARRRRVFIRVPNRRPLRPRNERHAHRLCLIDRLRHSDARPRIHLRFWLVIIKLIFIDPFSARDGRPSGIRRDANGSCRHSRDHTRRMMNDRIGHRVDGIADERKRLKRDTKGIALLLPASLRFGR